MVRNTRETAIEIEAFDDGARHVRENLIPAIRERILSQVETVEMHRESDKFVKEEIVHIVRAVLTEFEVR